MNTIPRVQWMAMAAVSFLIIWPALLFGSPVVPLQKQNGSLPETCLRRCPPQVRAGQMEPFTGPVLAAREQQESAVRRALSDRAVHDRLQSEIDGLLTPGFLMEAYLTSLGGGPITDRGEIKTGWDRLLGGENAADFGSISGYVTAAGWGVEANILAFDEHGRFVASVETDYWEGFYSLPVPAGRFYVMTYGSPYIDEFYEDVPAVFGSYENWRQADMVEVSAGEDVQDINFDLDPGAFISGNIYEADGVTLIEYVDILFRITSTESAVTLLEQEVYVYDGTFVISIPLTGTFRIFAEDDWGDYKGEWYENAETWEEASTVTVTALGDTVTGIDFSLEERGGEGRISGVVFAGNEGDSLALGLVVAFNMDDTTMAGIGLVMNGVYSIMDLPDGQYIVHAGDLPLGFMGIPNWVGEYYNNARTPDEATRITISGQNQVDGINFILDSGCVISGSVRGPQGEAIDSIFVLVLSTELLTMDPFFSNLQFNIVMTDANGNYAVDGLPTGEYILRTLTPDAWDLEALLGFTFSGKHFGKVVDEYYDGVPYLLDFAKATHVAVTAPATTGGINFTLEAAGRVEGTVTAAGTAAPLQDVLMFAFNAASGLPELAFGTTDSLGKYRIGPLPQGEYAIFAMMIQQNTYLAEFYNGARVMEDATLLTINPPGTVSNINFSLDLAAVIQGYVYLGVGYRAGADTMWSFPVMAYHAVDGSMAGMTWVSFNGGYGLNNLPQGTYKVCAMPIGYGYSATYHGGGNAFNDANTLTITIAPGDTFDADITLARGGGSIAGYVHGDDGTPVSGSVVIAYDGTGHAAGMAVSGYDWLEEKALDNNGAFEVQGLRSGSYSLRTWSPMSLLMMLKDMLSGTTLELDPAVLTALLSGGDLSDLGISVFEDKWYPDVAVPTMEYEIADVLIDALAYGSLSDHDPYLMPIYLPIPFHAEPHGNPVAVTAPQRTSNINFALAPVDILDVFTQYERGDVNQDGSLNVLDIITIANHILSIRELNARQQELADCNGDGNVNVLDMIALAGVLVGIFEECPDNACRPVVTPEVLELIETLQSYLSPQDFKTIMTLVRDYQLPSEFRLEQNSPNPFNPTTTISYSLPVQSEEFRVKGGDGTLNSIPLTLHVTLKIFNVLGQEVRTLVDEAKEPGVYSIIWDGTDGKGMAIPSGVYFYRLERGPLSVVRKMILMK